MTGQSDEEQDMRGGCLTGALQNVVIIAVALVIAFLLRMFVLEPYVVPTGSMLDTIQLGDCLLGEKVSYQFGSPQQGDVVIFSDPEDASTTLVKRVIATEGQTVDLRDGSVYVDGNKLDESYTEGKPSYPLDQHSSLLNSNIEYPYTVPDGCVWVMGDNRTNSLDSRYFGAIPTSSISSKGLMIYWPLSDFGAL